MAQTFTNNIGTVHAGVGRDYPMQMAIGRVGELFDISDSLIISGSNETNARIGFGLPLVRNSSGSLPNSAQVASAAGTLLGLSLMTDVNELTHQQAAVPYAGGVPAGGAISILKRGAIYIETVEAISAGNALRFYKSGPNAGKWGKTASAGNGLQLSAGAWEIERGAVAAGLAVLRINTPAALVFTADA
jgi:hypothetical protein